MFSNTAPAVLGRLSLILAAGPPNAKGVLKSRSPVVSEMSEEMLPETECPGRAVAVLEASLETRESGLGIYSNVSENPTRFLAGGLASPSTSAIGTPVELLGASDGDPMFGSDFLPCSAVGKSCPPGRFGKTGLAGALPPLKLGFGGGGRMMEERSWLDMAADRR